MTDHAEARRLAAAGRTDEAERLYSRIAECSPQDAEALAYLGTARSRRGESVAALALLDRAVAASPSNPEIRRQRARARHDAGDEAGTENDYREAVRLEPSDYTARLRWGESLAALGREPEAIVQYKRALDDAQRGGQWLNQATTPPVVRRLVNHAVLTVRNGRRAAFERLIDPLRERHGRESMRRVDQCIRIYLKEIPPECPDPRQQPSFLPFPGLPTMPYFAREDLPWIGALEARTAVIRAELDRLLDSSHGRERVLANDDHEAASLRGTRDRPSWDGYYFYRHGERRDDNCRACPATAESLDMLPLCRIRGHGPEVLFSVFTAGTHLLPHRGITNTRVVGHLPLIVPPDCAINVGGELHEWQEGRVVVFDDTFEHEAWNRSDRTRVVLIFDTWNPFLTEAEREALTLLVGDIGDFRSAVEAA